MSLEERYMYDSFMTHIQQHTGYYLEYRVPWAQDSSFRQGYEPGYHPVGRRIGTNSHALGA
jgi:hypothetical protein